MEANMQQPIVNLVGGLRSVGLLCGFLSLGAFAAGCNSGAPTLLASGAGTEESVGSVHQAVAGIDGSRTIATSGVVVNQYTTLAANPALNATSIQVASVAALANGADAIAAGDLVLIMQMQGATIDTSADAATWGQVTALGGAGLYEFAEVVAVDSVNNVLTLACALRNTYTTGGQTQVIRVPQYDTLTIAAGASITAPAWNGSVGGVVAVHAKTSISLAGDVNVTGLGFRGGVADNASAAAGTDTTIYASASGADGGRKGEGIAGLLPLFGRAPAANGGGGGNAHNAGGGGGANARNGAAWTGQGVFDLTVKGGATAWLLDPNYSATGSEGGGRGGYTYSQNDSNASTTAPGKASWGGNLRRQRGGLGGHPLDNDPATRIFMGGGGGAGDGNDGHSGNGGAGGGIAFLLAPTISGAGRILANGQNGIDANSTAGGAVNGDSPGGAGAGGSVVVRGTAITGISVQANGGTGGNQIVANGDEAEGPGGGGGGGFVSINATVTASAVGGAAGTTTSPALTEFPNNGATSGSAGQLQVAAAATGVVPFCSDTTAPNTTITTNPVNPTIDTTGDFTFTSDDPTATFECRIDGAAFAACTTPFASAPLAEGSHTFEVRAKDLVGNVDPTPATFTWVVDTTAPNTTILTNPTNPTADTTGDFTFGSNEAGVTFQCRVDGAAFATCTAAFATAALAEGSHTLEVRARDAAGNVDATPATYTWVVDTTAPNTTILTNPTNPTTDVTGDFTFGSNDLAATFECRVDAAAFAACSATFATAALTDGSHTLEVRARDAAGNVDATPATYTWVVDASPPDTTIVTRPPALTNDTTGDFTFTSNDGTATFECRVDTGTFAACAAAFATAALTDGSHTLEVRARDGAGNVDPTPATYTWVVDATAPSTTILTNPTNPSGDPTGDFTFGSDDPTATFECRVDTAAFAACSATFATAALSDGSHTLEVRARDLAGNVDTTPATFTWVLDASGPDTTIVTHPAAVTNDTTGDFTFSSDDPSATFECRVDTAAYDVCSATFATAALPDGTHSLDVRAKDALGNVDSAPATFTWVVDTTAPNTTIVSSPDASTTDATGDFTFGSDDPSASFECRVDAGAFAACSVTFSTMTLAPGAHAIEVRAKDAAGNLDQTPATFTWTVTAPIVDTDGDGLSDDDEGTFGTDPDDADSDDDGVPDGSEVDPGKDSDGDGLVNALDPDSDNDGILDGTEAGVTTAPAGTDVTKGHFVPDADPSTTTNPIDPDTDHGGVRDGSEDPNHNGKIDDGELDPNDPADDVTPPVDTDGDGLSDDEEKHLGTNPMDADSDDDGLLDGEEPNPSVDTDGDGLINPLDPDSDDDGLFDGTELGKDCSNADTAIERGLCVADADAGATVTSPINADTDGGTARDGSEDANLNGAVDDGETDPTLGHEADDVNVIDTDGDGLSDGTEGTLGSDPNDADTDDDGVLDGEEPNPSADGDGDGLIGVLDVDSDDDGLFDGTEMGRDCGAKDTAIALGHCRADADPATRTSPVNPDTDGGGAKDGSEDASLDGELDAGETDPTAGNGADDTSVVDSDGDGLSDGTEDTLGSDPKDADSDDDGLLDGEEPNPADDFDGDGAIDVLDSDSDDDGLFDGTEAGHDCKNPATDVTQNQCITDADLGKTKTRVLDADTDNGGVKDGVEDTNHDGAQQENERDPLDAADDTTTSPEGGAGGGGGEAGATPLGGSAGTAGSGTGGSVASGGTAAGGTAGSNNNNAGAAGHDDHVVVLGGGLCSYQPARAATNGAWLLLAAVGASALKRRRSRNDAKPRS
jgi:hypothetical protein